MQCQLTKVREPRSVGAPPSSHLGIQSLSVGFATVVLFLDNDGDLKLVRNQREVPLATNPIAQTASFFMRLSLTEQWIQGISCPRDGLANALLLAFRECRIMDLHFTCHRVFPKFFPKLRCSHASWLNLCNLLKAQSVYQAKVGSLG